MRAEGKTQKAKGVKRGTGKVIPMMRSKQEVVSIKK